MRWRSWAGVAGILIASGCSSRALTGAAATTTVNQAPKTAPARGAVSVVLFGDSLAQQAAPDFDRIIEGGGVTVADYVFGGTAVCDWLGTMSRIATARPRAAVLEFTGNTFTSCMKGFSPETSATISKYCADMESAIRLFLAVGTRVFLAGTPVSHAQWVTHDPHWDALNRAFAALAAKHPGAVTYIDAGAAVEGPGGAFTWTLPCLTSEPCVGPTVAGVKSNVVRAPDGVHFCPPTLLLGCSGYSSGAFRFATAMAEPVLRSFHLDG